MRPTAPLLLAALLFAPSASAREPARGGTLDLTLSEGCPDEKAFRHLVAASLEGNDPFVPDGQRRVAVTISRNGRKYHGEIIVYDRDGKRRGARVLADEPSCVALMASAATVLSVMLTLPPLLPIDAIEAIEAEPTGEQPPAPLELPSTSPPADHPLPTSPSPPSPKNAPPARASIPGALALSVPLAMPARKDVLPSDHDARAFWFQAGMGATLAVGTVGPDAAPGMSATLGLRWPTASLALEARGDIAGSPSATLHGGSVMNALFGGSIVPCVHHRWLLGCGLATVAMVHSAGKRVTPDRLTGPRVELGFRVGVEYAISAHLRAQLSGDFVAATARQGVKIDEQTMWDPSPLSVLPALRLLALF